MNDLIPSHGGYRNLKSFQNATIVYDFTVEFCKRFVKDYRMKDQMVQAARSGRQNIAEGCQVSGTSKKGEMKLVSVARASLEELLLDYEDYLRQRGLLEWEKDDSHAKEVRTLAYSNNRSYGTYETYISNPEIAANVAMCLIHQSNYLLDRQLRSLGEAFVENGGFTEQLYKVRLSRRGVL
ncbi:MAG: four helix bundle suffix domain-containing protein [bacterium]|nr:four helix bundle suffix domain-containing protein [bacterium]